MSAKNGKCHQLLDNGTYHFPRDKPRFTVFTFTTANKVSGTGSMLVILFSDFCYIHHI